MRNPKQCIWTSSYDRGLNHLLDVWPEVLKEIPDAKLIITYGWNLYDAAFPNNPERKAWKEKINKQMEQKGIEHRGRIGQREMVKLLQESGIWAYPTDFDEISCISAMKAQIYGAIPVTMKKAALKETVKWGELVPGDINDPKVKEIYTKFLIDWLKYPDNQEKTRQIMMEEAPKLFSWKGVAKNWQEEFAKPKVYSTEWAQEVWDRLPKELKEDSWKPYRLTK